VLIKHINSINNIDEINDLRDTIKKLNGTISQNNIDELFSLSGN